MLSEDSSLGVCDCRTDRAKVPSDSEDSTDLPADATESALHNALTDMHRRGANVAETSASNADSEAGMSTTQGDVKLFRHHVWQVQQRDTLLARPAEACAQECVQHSSKADYTESCLFNMLPATG